MLEQILRKARIVTAAHGRGAGYEHKRSVFGVSRMSDEAAERVAVGGLKADRLSHQIMHASCSSSWGDHEEKFEPPQFIKSVASCCIVIARLLAELLLGDLTRTTGKRLEMCGSRACSSPEEADFPMGRPIRNLLQDNAWLPDHFRQGVQFWKQ